MVERSTKPNIISHGHYVREELIRLDDDYGFVKRKIQSYIKKGTMFPEFKMQQLLSD